MRVTDRSGEPRAVDCVSFEMVQCRRELAAAVRMAEGKMTATDYKRHHATDSVDILIGRLLEEAKELADARLAYLRGEAKPHAIAMEAADVINFASMIIDQVRHRRGMDGTGPDGC